MTQAGSKKHRNEKLLDLAGKTCTDFAREFVTATKNRLREMRVISQILKIMRRRFGELPKDLVDYLEETKTGFKIYVNSTQFQKYQDYVQKHVADSQEKKTSPPTPLPAPVQEQPAMSALPRPR